jgi:hypothetical protein
VRVFGNRSTVGVIMGLRVFMVMFMVSLMAIFLVSCDDDPAAPGGTDENVSRYFASTNPDSVVANFVIAWEARDVVSYRDLILYNGTLTATDTTIYEPFKFYFAPPGHHDEYEEGTVYLYDDEIATITNMFSGNPSDHSSGIKSINLRLNKHQTWSDPLSDTDVEGDPYPPGTKRCIYTADLQITLKEPIDIGGIPINGFIVDDDIEFHMIPVGDPDNPRYRIWKWRDLSVPDGVRTLDGNWGSIKALYF